MRSELQYLIEMEGYDDSRTNLLPYSRQLDNAAWGGTGRTMTANAVVGADNQLLAEKLSATAVSSEHNMWKTAIVTNTAAVHTFSVYVKDAGNPNMRILVYGFNTANVLIARFNLTTGVMVSSSANGTAVLVSAGILPYPGGWYRVWVTGQPETPSLGASLNQVRIALLTSVGGITFTGDGVSGIYVDRTLLELGSVLGDPVDTLATGGPGLKTFRFCSGVGVTTRRTDTPAGVHYDPRVKTAINFNRNLVGQGRVSGGMRIDAGEIVLNNVDQGLASLRNYGFDGRSLVVRVGTPGAAYPAGFPAFMTGTMEQVEVGASKVTIRLRDRLQILSLPIQTTRYAGTNAGAPLLGAEGVAGDIKGMTKPLLYGRRYLIPAIVVNTGKRTYQIHDGAVQSIDAVYDQGLALTPGADYASLALLEAAVPGAGTFITCKALGLFRLGDKPIGKVLVDAQGDNTGGYISKPGEIINRLLITRCGFATGNIDSASFTAINAAVTGECGLYIAAGESVTRLEALSKLVDTFGGWLAPNRVGTWQVGRIVAPPGSPVLTFRDADIWELDAQATNDETRGVPTWRAILKYKAHAAGLSLPDLATTVAEDRRAEILQPWRTVEASDAAVKTKHLLATEYTRETLFNVEADASTEATRQLNMFKVRRDFVHAVVWLDTTVGTLDLGSEVRLITDRLGYSAGRNFIVLGVTLDGYSPKIGLDLWG